jgi:outer membrane protein assembly factor BamB
MPGARWIPRPRSGADGTIYVGCENGNLYALDPADGSQKWAYQTGGEIYTSSPAVAADGTIYIGSKTGFFAINPDGSLKWSYPTGDTEAGSPVIDPSGIIYVASWDHNLYEFNTDGTRRFTFSTGDAMAGAPAIDQDLCWVYIGSNDGYVYALDNDISTIWKFKTDNGMGMPAIGPDGNLYVGGLDGYLYSLNPYSGYMNWKIYLHNPIEATPAIGADGTIYVGTSAPYHANNDAVFAISPAGEEKWGFKGAGAPLDSSAAIGSDGTIYIGGQSSNFAAITPAGGIKWLFEGVSNLITTNTTPAIGEDGTIYFGADDDYVYAVH